MRLVLIFALAFFGIAPAAADEPRRITVFGATDTAAIVPIIAAFEKIHPGVQVKYREFNTGELHDHILRTAELPGPGADVVISSAMDLQVALVNLGLAHRFDPGAPVANAWRSELFGFTREPVAIVYNRAAFADRRLPQSRAELAGMIRDAPRFFQSRVGTYDVGLSGVGYLFATQDATRDHQHFRLIESLGRAGTRVFCCTADMLDSTASGNLVLSYNLIASYAAARAALDERIGIHFLDDYNLVMARTAFILRTAPNVPDAERFVRFLVSPEGQSVIARESGLSFALDTPTLGRKQFLDIRLGVGLLSYLDRMKKEKFLASWQAAMQPRRTAP